jgi:hypothetical protein
MDTDFQNLINRFKDFPVVEHKPSFLEIAGFPHRETVWRNIFAFFFDPNECHGVKDLFLRSFFDALDKQEQGTGDFDSMAVRTECQTDKGNYLDLLVRCNEFAIGIEMKVNAGLYNDLDDYGKLIDSQNLTGNVFKVVLSNAPCKTYGAFANLRYADLVPAIQANLGDYVLRADPKYTSLLLDFLNHVTSYIGGYAMDIDPKLLQFMKDNHNTVQRLFKTHNDLRRLLEEKMAQVNDAVALLDSLKALVIYRKRLFSWHGDTLSKIHFKTNQIGFWYQFGITDDYCVATDFWLDDQSKYKHLKLEMLTAGISYEKFDLSMPIDGVVSAVEKTLLSMIVFLSKK